MGITLDAEDDAMELDEADVLAAEVVDVVSGLLQTVGVLDTDDSSELDGAEIIAVDDVIGVLDATMELTLELTESV